MGMGMHAIALTPTAQIEMGKQYRNALSRFYAYEASLLQIINEDFPDGKRPEVITRYHLDAVNDLTSRLAALVEGYQRRS